MSRLPNYKLRYGILLSMCSNVNVSNVDATLFSREYRCSRSVIYRTVENIIRDIDNLQKNKDI